MDINQFVYKTLRSKKQYESRVGFLSSIGPKYQSESHAAELAHQQMMLNVIDSWLTRLHSDERFVVVYHLIEGYDWDRIVDEHKRRWGDKGRANRTLRSYQESAIKKIALMIRETPETYQQLIFRNLC